MQKLRLGHKKKKVPSTTSLIVDACNETCVTTLSCHKRAPAGCAPSSRQDCFCLPFFFFRSRAGRWIISSKKDDIVRDNGWIMSVDKRKDPTLVKKWEVYDGSNWIRSASARVVEISKRASWRPDLNFKRDVSKVVRRAARRSVYKKYGKRGLKNLYVFHHSPRART